MSDSEKQQLLDAIHKQLDHAISYNLYTGLAYGTFRSVRPLLVQAQVSVSRNVLCRVLHLNQDPSVSLVLFIPPSIRALTVD